MKHAISRLATVCSIVVLVERVVAIVGLVFLWLCSGSAMPSTTKKNAIGESFLRSMSDAKEVKTLVRLMAMHELQLKIR